MARRLTRLLVVTRHNPFPENDGAGAYLFDIVEYVAKHDFTVEVAWLHADGAIKSKGRWRIPEKFRRTAQLQIIGGKTIGRTIYFAGEYWYGRKARILNTIKVTLKKLGLSYLLASREARKNSASSTSQLHNQGILTKANWSAPPSPAETAFFKKRLHAFRPDAVLLNYCWLAPLLDGLADLPTAILTNDVVSQRLERTPGLAIDPATPEGEASLLARARHTLAISQDDAEIFRAMLPSQSIINTPKAAAPRSLLGAPVPQRVLFVGGINDFNLEGILWFLVNAWPLVHAKNNQAVLHICGGIGSALPEVPAGVVVRGRVLDLAVEYTEASAVIVPLLHGTGVKIKLVEAASYGKAIITTPVGLQGLGFLRPAVVEAEQSTLFAEGVLRVLCNPDLQKSLGQTVLHMVTTHLSADSAYGPALQALSGSNS